jgi:hypothetical protein
VRWLTNVVNLLREERRGSEKSTFGEDMAYVRRQVRYLSHALNTKQPRIALHHFQYDPYYLGTSSSPLIPAHLFQVTSREPS